MNNVLITGGSGTLGRALVRRLLAIDTERIAIYSRDEMKQLEMRLIFDDDPRLRFFIGDVRDRSRLSLACRGVDTVIHAAALKQIPAAEYNPTECIDTNIQGTRNVIEAAIQQNVMRVLGVSTDKASSPVTLYGATKLAMERLLCAANAYSGGTGPSFACVRYGNVAGSRGSVIPYWRDLADQGKPLPVTDTRMTRYYMTVGQAVDFVLYGTRAMRGGEVFVPHLPSFRIIDLWRVMTPTHDAEPVVTGIRPGEKLHESLISADEATDAYELRDGYVLARAIADEPHPRTTGNRVQDGFSYTSQNNGRWLNADELKQALGAV